ncbi:MAG: response regulator [Veillonellaceae bacterium]|nr:response regulator [Veillonellaceae bacterium]MDD6922925.1 response regulator [Veillonellaceae bacterium]
MEKVKVMIVDDSRVSATMLQDILSKTNFEVCAVARTAAEALELYKRNRPAVVTMDMNLPDANGIVCSAKIHEEDPKANIVMISAMKDASLITQGREAGISAFLQKPVSTNELLDTLMLLTQERVGKLALLRDSYVKSFMRAMQDSLKDLAGLASTAQIEVSNSNYIEVDGVSVILGLTGKPMGRAVVYMDMDMARRFTAAMLHSELADISEEEANDSVEEASNIIVGRGVSIINDIFKDREMRITPPGTICGQHIRIVNMKLTSFTVTARTEAGTVYMNIGFAEEK